MYQPNRYRDQDPAIVKIISKEVAKLAGRYAIDDTELNDIEQDLHLRVWFGGTQFENIPRNAVVRQIVDNRIKDLIKERKRECRDYRKVAFSLNEKMEGTPEENDEEIGHAMDWVRQLEHSTGAPAPWHQRRDAAADVHEALQALPKELRRLADALDAYDGNLAEAARQLKFSRKKARLLLEKLQSVLRFLIEK